MTTGCPRCGMPQSSLVGSSSENDENQMAPVPSSDGDETWNGYGRGDEGCNDCRGKSLEFDGLIALWAYSGRVCDAIVAAKYVYNAPLADAMGRRLGATVADRLAKLNHSPPDCVTYVPSHVTRQMSRGGNAIIAVAQTVARAIDRPCRKLLKANRMIKKQAWLDDDARQKNVHGAFSVRKSYASPRSPQLANQHILVVDDVYTTGATGNAVASALKQAGVARVTWVVTARTVRGR